MSILLLASLVVAGSAASEDITNIPGILNDIKTAATTIPTASDFENSYQQFAELLAPVMLLTNGLNFEVRTAALLRPQHVRCSMHGVR